MSWAPRRDTGSGLQQVLAALCIGPDLVVLPMSFMAVNPSTAAASLTPGYIIPSTVARVSAGALSPAAYRYL